MKIEIGDVVRHPDGDIGVVLDKMDRGSDGMLYEIHWMNDGFLRMVRYKNLEVING